MSDDFGSAVSGIGVLVEPARRVLYLYAAAQPDAVTREQAAEACGVALHKAKFHLDRLVEEGLLEAEYRRVSGRSGPGAGRPSKLYRRATREISVSLPERKYDLAGDLLAAAIEHTAAHGGSVRDAVQVVATRRGRELGEQEDGGSGSEMERTAEVLAGQGYEPRPCEDALCLANCPFDRLAKEHTELVCGMNHAFVGGVLEGLGCDSLDAVLEPDPSLCCVKARPRR